LIYVFDDGEIFCDVMYILTVLLTYRIVF